MPDGVTSELFVKRFFAKTYGYTEVMTEESSIAAVTWWPLMEEAEADAEEKRIREESRRADRGRHAY